MRITYLHLVGYIGIYNGLGLNEIAIDFNKCKYKKIVIKGANGSGKSTLLKALNVMPDSNSVLIPYMECKKEISIINKDVLYNIQIIHPLNNKGERSTTKGYIQKMSPEGMIELNPNGNISSYKEIIYSELNLDPNFIALSQLGSENKGLASLKPADRKKFVNSIIGSISSYNDMNKTFTKRSNIFKSMRNSIISKIDNLGNKDKLLLALNNIEMRYTQLSNLREVALNTISQERAKIQMLDKDNEIQNKFSQVNSEIKIINANLYKLDNKLKMANKKSNMDISEDMISVYLNSLNDTVTRLKTIIKLNQSKIESMLTAREEDAKQLQIMNGKLKSLESENMTKSNLKNLIEQSNKKIDDYSKMIYQMKIKDINNISKDEYILALDSLHDIEEIINNLKSSYSYEVITNSIAYLEGNKTFDDGIEERIRSLKNNLEVAQKQITQTSRDKQLLDAIFSEKPEDCNNKKCPFIKEALELMDMYENNDLGEYLSLLKSGLENIKNSLEYEERSLALQNEISNCMRDMNNVIRNIDRNSNVIRKLLVDEKFLNSSRILDIIESNDIFKEIDMIYQYIDAANIIDCYKIEIERVKEYQNQLNILGEKETITNNIIDQVKYIQTKLDQTNVEINKLNKEIIDSKNSLSDIKSEILEVEYIKDLYDAINENKENKNRLLDEFSKIKDSMISIKESSDIIDRTTNDLNNINKELMPLTEERDKIKHSIKLYDEYQIELEEYNKKYELIETLKKYSSPTSGIQTIFINLYMNKTLSLANQLLQLMFNGKYVLCQFVINDHEFRIPCVGSGLINDDVSSMSLSETCMIGMIISFAILQQASTDYNILILDEIDSGLDTNNRLTFLTVLEEMINMLDVEQCFIISHNDEINLNSCDIIVLKNDGQYNNIEGNVIFKY